MATRATSITFYNCSRGRCIPRGGRADKLFPLQIPMPFRVAVCAWRVKQRHPGGRSAIGNAVAR